MTCFGPKTPDVGGICTRLCRCILTFLVVIAMLVLNGWILIWARQNLLAAGLSLGIVLPFVVIGEVLRPHVDGIKEEVDRWSE